MGRLIITMSGLSQTLKRVAKRGIREANKMLLSSPKLVECNVCGWQGKHFLDSSWHSKVICPKCASQVRHRLMFAALLDCDYIPVESLLQGKKILHFAPEKIIQKFLKKFSSNYISADLYRKNVDLNIDISDMSSIESSSFDLVVACDVLEHVASDIQAMREVMRILKPQGYAILTVPQQDNLAKTFEDASIATPPEREKVFGQQDHCRMYGDDFVDRLELVGFDVTIISEKNITQSLSQKYVLYPETLSNKPLATNHRKIFFAKKLH